jgi:transposase
MKGEYLGIDLHSTQITVHRILVHEDGTVERHNGRYTAADLETKFVESLSEKSAVCIEAGTGAHTLARMLAARGARVFLVNPLQMPQIFLTAKKTDKVDAKKLADALKRHVESGDAGDLLPEVYIADPEAQRLRMLVAQYQRVTADMTALRNNLYALFRQWLVPVEKGLVIDNLEASLAHPRVPPELKMIARVEKERYDRLEAAKAEYRAAIEQLGVIRFREPVSLLIGISGVSVFGAACIMSDIITIDRFKTCKQLASYLRAAPRVDASNKTIHIGRLNKAGRKMAFEILLQSVNHLIDGNPHLLAYTQRTVGKSRNKIRATVVARAIRQIFYILKNREPNRYLSIDCCKTKQRRMEILLQTQNCA